MIVWRSLKWLWAWMTWEPTWPARVQHHLPGLTSCTTVVHETLPIWMQAL